MLWHKDTVLTEPPQLELVYTLENTSDSVTRWATSHLDVLNCRVQEVWTAPNSALLVQAGCDARLALRALPLNLLINLNQTGHFCVAVGEHLSSCRCPEGGWPCAHGT